MLSLVIDTETTGVNPALDRVCEIAVVLTDWKQVYAVLSTYVNPGFAFRNTVNGLSDAQVRDAPSFRSLLNDGFIYLLGSADEYIGHQADFDIRFLSVELRHFGLHFPRRSVYDTWKLCGRASLREACERYKINTDDITWHSALGDAVATFRLARKLKERANEEDIDNSPTVGLYPRLS